MRGRRRITVCTDKIGIAQMQQVPQKSAITKMKVSSVKGLVHDFWLCSRFLLGLLLLYD